MKRSRMTSPHDADPVVYTTALPGSSTPTIRDLLSSITAHIAAANRHERRAQRARQSAALLSIALYEDVQYEDEMLSNGATMRLHHGQRR